jgi:hypothetical protein
MTFNNILGEIQRQFPLAFLGKTCQLGSVYFKCAHSLCFSLCQCSASHPEYNAIEYIACGKRGGRWYIGYSNISRMITCGPKGFHYYHTELPSCK